MVDPYVSAWDEFVNDTDGTIEGDGVHRCYWRWTGEVAIEMRYTPDTDEWDVSVVRDLGGGEAVWYNAVDPNIDCSGASIAFDGGSLTVQVFSGAAEDIVLEFT
jgi:hypothetical protein